MQAAGRQVIALGTESPEYTQDRSTQSTRPHRRTRPCIAAIAALAIVGSCVVQHTQDQQQTQQRQAKAAAYKERPGTKLHIDGVETDAIAQRSTDKQRVVIELRPYFHRTTKFLHIDDPTGNTAQNTLESDQWYPKDPQIVVPVKDPLTDVTVHAATDRKTWKKSTKPSSRQNRLSPTDVAYDTETGERLPPDP